MFTKEAKRGSGEIQWNTWGWFGAQIGSTFWLLIAGQLLLFWSFLIGILLTAYFLIPNYFGLLIWQRRDRIAPYPALQALIAVIGLFSLIAVITFDVSGLMVDLEPGLRESPGKVYQVLFTFPILMIFLHFSNRSSGKKDSSG